MPRKLKADLLKDKISIAIPPLPPQPPPAPEPPNPVVLALQEQILGLVNQRGAAQGDLANANAALRNAQAAAESARERLQAVEGEVQYRFGLIAQMQGKPAHTQITGAGYPDPPIAPFFDLTPSMAGVGSIPPRRAPMAGVMGEARTESAEDVRRSI